MAKKKLMLSNKSNEDDKEILKYILGGKMHTIELKCGDTEINISDIGKNFEKIVDDNEELCKNIYHLGLGMLGSPGLAHGFLAGWITKSIKDSIEKKCGSSFVINHESEEIDKAEMKEHYVKMFRAIADDIENDEDFDGDGPMVRSSVGDTSDFS